MTEETGIKKISSSMISWGKADHDEAEDCEMKDQSKKKGSREKKAEDIRNRIAQFQSNFNHRSDEHEGECLAVVDDIIKAMNMQVDIRPRAILYRHTSAFRSMERVYYWLRKLSSIWRIHSSFFNVIPQEKGWIAGPMKIYLKVGNVIVQIMPQSEKVKVVYVRMPIFDISQIKSVEFTTRIPWVIVLEKETVFKERVDELNRLYQSGNREDGFGIIITGRGFADQATIRFLRYLRDRLPPSTPFALLTDADPYGIRVALQYNSPLHFEDSSNFKYDKLVKWVGLLPSKWKQYVRNDADKIRLTENDQKVINDLLKKDDLPSHIRSELKTMRELGFKLSLDIAWTQKLTNLLP